MPLHDPMLILASASPRRHALLAKAGIAFEILPSGIEENESPGESPEALVERLAIEKAVDVAKSNGIAGAEPRRWILGADTIVVVDSDVLGKPRDPEHAVELLSRIVGRSHRVLTGVALVSSDRLEIDSEVVESLVTMRSADEAEIRDYIAGGEPLDKAGAYAVQGEGRKFVERVDGSETNVIGLPMEETLSLLAGKGLAGSRKEEDPGT